MIEYKQVINLDAVNALAEDGWVVKFFQAGWEDSRFEVFTYYVMERITYPVPAKPLPTLIPGPGMRGF